MKVFGRPGNVSSEFISGMVHNMTRSYSSPLIRNKLILAFDPDECLPVSPLKSTRALCVNKVKFGRSLAKPSQYFQQDSQNQTIENRQPCGECSL